MALSSGDGATEARNGTDELYSLSRLGQKLSLLGAASADELLDALLNDVHAFNATEEFADDITLVVVKRSSLTQHA